MALLLGNIIAKIGEDGLPVTDETYRKFRVVGTGSISDWRAATVDSPATSRVLTLVSLEAIE